MITFDDGCQNVFDHGLEILARHQFRAIQFLVAGFIGRHNEWDMAAGDSREVLMDAARVREWAAGHEIGHSMTHRNLKKLSDAELREEIFASEKELEDTFGLAIRHFCYSFGCFNERVRETFRQAGYETACAVQFGVNNSLTPRFALRRIFPLTLWELTGKAWHRMARRMNRKRTAPLAYGSASR